MRENRTKRLLKDGKTAIGGWVVSEDPTTTEIMADVGFDFVVVDTEHAPQTATGLQAHMMTLKDTPATGVVRVVWNDFVRVKQALDVGAEGIVFPWVNTVEQARAAVASTRYPPRGNRGWGPRRAIRFATDQMDYFRHAEENILVLCQIETQEALDNAEAIAAADGVDALMVGPADFSINIGVPLDWDCDKFMAGIRRVRQAADAAGKAFGVITSGAAYARRWLAEGARVIIAGSDGAFLKMMAQATLGEIRQAIG
ncbi:MAG TPA: aldolase/citrate lyase family protein [Planctomycetota bacterium]|nr:aldolase/citrate lyase family protein [Planctomycetota bacterium]